MSELWWVISQRKAFIWLQNTWNNSMQAMWTDWCFNDELYSVWFLLFHYFMLVITDYHWMKMRFIKNLQLFSFCVFAAGFFVQNIDEKRPLVKTWFRLHHHCEWFHIVFSSTLYRSRISKTLDVTTSSKVCAICF